MKELIRILTLALLILIAMGPMCYAQDLPIAYQKSFLELKEGESVNVGDKLAVTVEGHSFLSYAEFHEQRYSNSLKEGEYPEFCIVVDLRIRNISDAPIAGWEIQEAISPIFYFLSAMDESEFAQEDHWFRWENIYSDRYFKLYGLDISMDSIRMISGSASWEDEPEINDCVIEAGDEIIVTDLRGSLDHSGMQRHYWPIGYEISYNGDTERVMLQEFTIDFNDPECFIGDGFYITIDLLLRSPMDSEYELIEKYRKIWGPLKGREMYLELTRAWQEVFGMEVTGVLDQELLCRLIHYNITHD